ncbi:hypothetical protein [Streptomyces sp. CC224B]|uniref:hypothetical protein n=1 Tax=Streptomyces sp. CC224B TaxID=3044571 RepID=UPI0024A91525|nr:hypothetical protein [Streptomyces sp. CC224B]
MTDRLSPQREAEIAARENAATPGPWGTYEYGGGSLLEIAADLQETGCGYRARRSIARLEDEPLDNDPAHKEWTEGEDWTQVKSDAAFVAHAREDVPALIAELAAVRTERDEARTDLAKYVGHEPTIAEEMTYLRRCLADVRAVCDKAERDSLRWEHPLPVPEWVHVVREAADGVRPPGQGRTGDVVQYGIRIPDGSVLNSTVTDLVEQGNRLVRYRDCWPDAVLVQRSVFHGEWTEVGP